MTNNVTAIVQLQRDVYPSRNEELRLAGCAEELIRRTEAAIEGLPVCADVIQTGSTARGTWISGDHDIDVFVRFPTNYSREQLERYGLQVGKEVLPDSREEFAEHPYVTGEYLGFVVDIVPCFAVENASAIQSAVDRTPFHTKYLSDHLNSKLAREVRLTKGFLKKIGIYGSDVKTKGFSGIFTELLVLEYGDFLSFIDAVADWRLPVKFDPEDHGTRSFDAPLVVIDPTDPERNVAAVCSATNVARLIHYARAFHNDLDMDQFGSDDPDPLSPDEMRFHLDRRETTPVAVRFDAPDLVEDQLFPQLERSLGGIRGELDRCGFETLRAATFADDSAVLFVECKIVERPAIERHEGPPVDAGKHASDFYDTYVDSEAYGPFVDGERYVVERPREFTSARSLLEEELFSVALGSHVESVLREGYEVLVGRETSVLVDEFGTEFARYFDPKP